ncbi:hypothetical protein EDD21DRAFT_385876 [Dissophora ornata]|nr:hypothetical protein EDD21DRAFT_385876 [Dissophora ornata]
MTILNKFALALLMVSAAMILQSAASPIQSSTGSINLQKRQGCAGRQCGIFSTNGCCLGYGCNNFFKGVCVAE